MTKHILALDQGTTSSRAILFDHAGSIVAVAQKEFPQIFPRPGWVEHDPRDIWSSQAGVAGGGLTKGSVSAAGGSALRITKQRGTNPLWGRSDRGPICKANVLEGRRTPGAR